MSSPTFPRREVRNFDAQMVSLALDVQPRFKFAADELISLSERLFDVAGRPPICWHIQSGLGGSVNYLEESIPILVILADMAISHVTIRTSHECDRFCLNELGSWSIAQLSRRFFEPEVI